MSLTSNGSLLLAADASSQLASQGQLEIGALGTRGLTWRGSIWTVSSLRVIMSHPEYCAL